MLILIDDNSSDYSAEEIDELEQALKDEGLLTPEVKKEIEKMRASARR